LSIIFSVQIKNKNYKSCVKVLFLHLISNQINKFTKKMRFLLILITLSNGLASEPIVNTKSFSFRKKAPNTTPNSLKKYVSLNTSSSILSLTTNSYSDLFALRREGEGVRLKKVREESTFKFKKFLNTKSLSKNLYNLCWSNPCKNAAKCYGSVSKFKCK
jgi:hypothetical protein